VWIISQWIITQLSHLHFALPRNVKCFTRIG
jgi:hypothetical protein